MNVIEQAEALCKNRVPDELTSGECECCNLLPDLVAECKRLEAEAQDYHDQKEAALSQLVRERQELQAEAARWQKVAVEEHAKVLCAARLSVCCRYSDIDEATMVEEVTDEDRQQAAAALGNPRAWLMNEERIKALDEALNAMEWVDKKDSGFGLEDERAVLQAMLVEAGQ